jgi:predicted permease
VRVLDTIGRDLRLAVRALRAAPIVATVAVLSLALGIGANTAIFSIINSLVLRTLPVSEPDRLVLVSDTTDHASAWSYPIWLQIHQRSELFEDSAAWSITRFNLTSGGGETQFVNGLWVSGSFFRTLGVTPAIGRLVSATDDRRTALDAPAAVVSYGFWQRRFGGAADIVGRTITLDGASFTIVGVTPQAFFGAEVGRAFDVAVPLAAEPLSRGRDTYLDSVSSSFLTIVGRLRRDQSLEAAASGLRQAQPAIREATSAELSIFGGAAVDRYLKAPFVLLPGATGFEGASDLRGRYARPLWTMLGVVAIVLTIACVNVANLLLARANARQHELSVRVALGASRSDLVRQLLAESLLLSAAGAAGGLCLATWSGRFLVSQLSTSVNTVVLDLPIDGRIVAFTIGLAAFTTLLFGTAPAFRASGAAPMDALKDHSRGTTPARGRLADAFVVVQVALSVVLLVAAGLFVRTFAQLATRPLGFQAAQVTIVQIDARRSSMTPAARLAAFERARDAVRALADVDDAALSFITPFTGGFTPPVKISGTPVAVQSRLFGNLISPGWFTTFGTPLLSGRDLTDRDRPGAPRVVVVNETFARTFFPDRSPLGQTLVLYADTSRAMPPMEIVGVIGDAVYSSIRAAVPPTWYAPLAQFDMPEFSIPSIRLSVRIADAVSGVIKSGGRRHRLRRRRAAADLPSAGGSGARGAHAGAAHRATRRILRRARPPARRPRAVRRDLVRGHAPPHGDRHSTRPRRRTQSGRRMGAGPRVAGDRRRNRGRRRDQPVGVDTGQRPDLRPATARPGHAPRRGSHAGAGRGVRRLASGPPGRAHRSARRPPRELTVSRSRL